MAEFLRLTVKGKDGTTNHDMVVNCFHIGTFTPCIDDPECVWLSTRGGLQAMKPIKVVGTPEQITEALCQDCKVAILSLNDRSHA